MMGWGEMGYPDFIRNVFRPSTVKWTSVVAKMVKKLSAKPSLIPGSGRPPGERNGSVQSLSCVWLFVTPWTEASEASLSITSSRSLLRLMSVESGMPSSHLILLSPSPPFNLSQHQGLFQWVSGYSRVFSNTTGQKYQFFSAQLSFYSPTLTSIHDYWKTIALTRRTFVDNVMSLHFNMLSRLVIAFLPRSKRLLISWLQSPFAVILEPWKIKSVTVSIVSPSICMEW